MEVKTRVTRTLVLSQPRRGGLRHGVVYFLRQNSVNLYWIFGVVITFWFTVVRGLPYLASRPVLDIGRLHVQCSMVLAWLMAWNLVFLPRHGPLHRRIHIIVGRAVVVLSYVSALGGFYATWVINGPSIDSFKVGISIGGVMQLLSTLRIKRTADEKNTEAHRATAHGLFYMACLIPAIMRTVDLLPFAETSLIVQHWNLYSGVFGFMLCAGASRAVKARRFY
mmetsp:Transcript_666/g.2230  ORF Transcript_666/g.2230 Transcript_666/m.2230 type:complete len:223 (-) Transcript_666:365-1033(-)